MDAPTHVIVICQDCGNVYTRRTTPDRPCPECGAGLDQLRVVSAGPQSRGLLGADYAVLPAMLKPFDPRQDSQV